MHRQKPFRMIKKWGSLPKTPARKYHSQSPAGAISLEPSGPEAGNV